MIIYQQCLQDFYADLWNSAEQTSGNSRFLRSLSCWLVRDIDSLPDYMKKEYNRGRVIIYPLFPKYVHQDMEYKSGITK